MSELALISKIVITFILVAKYSAFFCTVLMDASERARFAGLTICAVVNVLLVAFFVWKGVWTAIASCAVLAVLAVAGGANIANKADN